MVTTAGTTALVEAQRIHSHFSLPMAVFSFYIVGFGYRSVFLKPLAGSVRVLVFDWLAADVGLAVFLGTMACVFRAGNISTDVFGSFGAMTTFHQLRGYANAGHWAKNQWLLNHILGFRASYIAAVSAFSVISLHFNSFPCNFLWPMAPGTLLFIWWHRWARGPRVTLAPSPDLSGSPVPAPRK